MVRLGLISALRSALIINDDDVVVNARSSVCRPSLMHVMAVVMLASTPTFVASTRTRTAIGLRRGRLRLQDNRDRGVPPSHQALRFNSRTRQAPSPDLDGRNTYPPA
jgi:hypothetical protein